MSEKKERPAISIIVPVFNVEKYLRRCIDSILAQTFSDFECILIDDGSPDNCGKICDEYARKDGRIKVIHQKNAGVSAARNAGLSAARGEWIGFTDSDDYIEKNMYEYMYNAAKENSCEVVMCDFFPRDKYFAKRGTGKVRKMLGTEEALALLFSEKCGAYSFLHLVDAEKVRDLRFDTKITLMEDAAFFYELFKNCERIFYHNIPLYHYEHNPQSLTCFKGLSAHSKSALDLLDRLVRDEKSDALRKIIFRNRNNFLMSLFVHYVKTLDFADENYSYLHKRVSEIAPAIIFGRGFTIKRRVIAFLVRFTPIFKPSQSRKRKSGRV